MTHEYIYHKRLTVDEITEAAGVAPVQVTRDTDDVIILEFEKKLGTDVLTWVRPETALSIERGSRGAISYEDIGRWAKAHAKVRLRAAA